MFVSEAIGTFKILAVAIFGGISLMIWNQLSILPIHDGFYFDLENIIYNLTGPQIKIPQNLVKLLMQFHYYNDP